MLFRSGKIKMENGLELEYKCINEEMDKEDKEYIENKIGNLILPIEFINKDYKDILKKDKVEDRILSGKESAYLSKELAAIKTDIEGILPENLDELKCEVDKESYKKEMIRLEMKSIINL